MLKTVGLLLQLGFTVLPDGSGILAFHAAAEQQRRRRNDHVEIDSTVCPPSEWSMMVIKVPVDNGEDSFMQTTDTMSGLRRRLQSEPLKISARLGGRFILFEL